MKWIKFGISVIYLMIVFISIYYWGDIYFLTETLLIAPICIYFILIVHELFHVLFFSLFQIPIVELCIGLFSINMRNNHFKINLINNGLFSGYCLFVSQANKKEKIIAALIAGGISGIIIGIIALILLVTNAVSIRKSFLWDLIFGGFYSFYVTLLNKKSADRIAIRKVLKRK